MPGYSNQTTPQRGVGSARSRRRLRTVTFVLVVLWSAVLCLPDAFAAPTAAAGSGPSVKMFGYAKGPAQRTGSAAGQAHHVPASATRARGLTHVTKGHRAPVPAPVQPPVGSRTLVSTGRPAGRPGIW